MINQDTIVWITGVSGFTGRHMVHYLLQEIEEHNRPKIVGIDRVKLGDVTPFESYVVGDLGEPELTNDLLTTFPPDYIIHLAGVTPPAQENLCWDVNLKMTLDFARRVCGACPDLRSFVSIGSAAEYGTSFDSRPYQEKSFDVQPKGAYGESKLYASWALLGLAQNFGFPISIARPFNLIGPGSPSGLVLGRVIQQLKEQREVLSTGPLSSVRDFVDVRDVVRGYWRMATCGYSGEIFNLARGEGLTVRDVVQRLLNACSQGSISIQETHVIGLIDHSIADVSKAKDLLNWAPKISLNEALHDMLEFEGLL